MPQLFVAGHVMNSVRNTFVVIEPVVGSTTDRGTDLVRTIEVVHAPGLKTQTSPALPWHARSECGIESVKMQNAITRLRPDSVITDWNFTGGFLSGRMLLAAQNPGSPARVVATTGGIWS